MARSTNGVLDEIRARVDIVDIVSAYTTLRKAGRSHTGTCPFHSEKTPSFHVYPESWDYHCFGCRAHGDGFTILMEKEGLTFGEAVQQLAARGGIDVPTNAPSRETIDSERRLREMHIAAEAYFVTQLARSSEAQQYLEGREITQATIDRFGLGFAPDLRNGLLEHLTSIGYTRAEIVEGGLAVQRDDGSVYDRFRNRLIIPIRDTRKTTVAFGGRAFGDSQPKYLNSPETPIFSKGTLMYGLDQAGGFIRERDQAVIMEGYFDVIRAHQAGYGNAVAPMGTALTDRQVVRLVKMTKHIVLALDADSAGQAATKRALDVIAGAADVRLTPVVASGSGSGGDSFTTWRNAFALVAQSDVDLRILSIPEGKDPDDYIRANPDGWPGLLSSALPVIEYLFKSVLDSADLSDPTVKSQAVASLLPAVHRLGDLVQRQYYTEKLASRLQIDPRALYAPAEPRRFTNDRDRRKPKLARPERRDTPAMKPIELAVARERKREQYALSLLLRFPDLDPVALGYMPEVFEGTNERALYLLRLAGEEPTDDVLVTLAERVALMPMPAIDRSEAERALRQVAEQLRQTYQRRVIRNGGSVADSPDALAPVVEEANRLLAVWKSRKQGDDVDN